GDFMRLLSIGGHERRTARHEVIGMETQDILIPLPRVRGISHVNVHMPEVLRRVAHSSLLLVQGWNAVYPLLHHLRHATRCWSVIDSTPPHSLVHRAIGSFCVEVFGLITMG